MVHRVARKWCPEWCPEGCRSGAVVVPKLVPGVVKWAVRISVSRLNARPGGSGWIQGSLQPGSVPVGPAAGPAGLSRESGGSKVLVLCVKEPWKARPVFCMLSLYFIVLYCIALCCIAPMYCSDPGAGSPIEFPGRGVGTTFHMAATGHQILLR